MRAGRLGNVTGVLLLGGEGAWSAAGPARVAGQQGALFEESLVLGGAAGLDLPGTRVAPPGDDDSPLGLLLAALEAASGERVLVVAAEHGSVGVELMLALTAWPEADAVLASEHPDSEPVLGIYRRDIALSGARRARDAGARDLTALHERLEVERVALAELGLADRLADGRAAGRSIDALSRPETR